MMNYKPPEHQPQVETTPVEGRHLPQRATQINALEDKIKQLLSVCNDIKHKKVIENIVKGYKAGYTIVLCDINTKKPLWLGMTPATYKVDLETLLKEYLKNPDNLGYGVLIGQQQGGFYVVAVDVDVDNEDCKEKIAKEIETRAARHGVYLYKETTKTGRLHYYALFDNITKEIESITELPFPEPCFKWKGGSKLPGKIEVFAKRTRYIIVYDGIINDNDPFFSLDKVFSDPTAFIDYVNNWFETFTPIELDLVNTSIKEAVKEPIKEPIKVDKSTLFDRIVEAYKIIRNYHAIDGWEIEKTFSAYCVRENIDMEQSIEGFKAIYGSEYDEKRTLWLLETTKKKDLALLPSFGSIHYHVTKALNSNVVLNDYEKEVLEGLLVDLELNGYGYVLPEYLRNAENVILYESIEKTNKENKKYYEESYFIELYDDKIKEVIFITVNCSEYKGIYKPHKLLHQKNVGIKTDIVKSIREGKFEDYEYLLNDKIVYRPSFATYTKVDDLIYDLGLISMKYNKFTDLNLYKRYIDKKTKMYVKENNDPKPCVINDVTGWDDDFTGFYHPCLNSQYHELKRDHVLYRKKKDKVLNKDAQHELVKALLSEGKLLGVLLTISVASLLIKPLSGVGFTTIISGTTGVGKTTASLVATSLFYYSDTHLVDAQMTKTALELMIAALNSLPVLIDEAALAVNYTLEDLVFMVSSGKGKARGRKDLSVDFKDLKSNVFWTSETTDVDELRRSGALRRIMYIVVDAWDEFTSLFKAEDRVNEQYAGCGIDYIQYLMENMEEIKKAFKEQTQELYTEYRDILTIALNLWSGLVFLEAYYNTKFERLRKTIHKLLGEQKSRFIDSRDNVTIQVRDVLESVTMQRFHVIKGYRKDTDELDIDYARLESWGEYDKMEGIYYLTPVGLKAIADRLGKNKNILLKELEKSGALIAKNKSHYFQATKNKGKVHKLKFRDLNDDDEQSPEQEQKQELTPDLDVPF